MIAALLEEAKQIGNMEYAGILLIIRMEALLGSLLGEPIPCPKIVLTGSDAEAVAKAYLRTMCNEVDTINLDSDRIGYIRKKVLALGETPGIFLLSRPDEKSARNRVGEIMGWAENGRIDGIPITIPFVFCLRRMSKFFPFFETIVLDTGRMEAVGDGEAFSNIQAYFVNKIEKSGTYMVEVLRNEYKERLLKYKEIPLFAWACSVVDLMQYILDGDMPKYNSVYNKIVKMLHAGLNEIFRQMDRKTEILLEQFRDAVTGIVDEGKIVIAECRCVPDNVNRKTLYFDGDFYYLTQDLMKYICEKAGISQSSIPFVKQEVIGMDLAKVYRNMNQVHRDLNVDFPIIYQSGEEDIISGFAIKHSFWDKLGGIALYERGGTG